MKPLLDGKALAKALSASPGPWMRDALDVVMAWQLRNPGKTSTEEALEEVKNTRMHGELTASLITHFLRLTIRPLFAKTQPRTVTAQGRKVTTIVLPPKSGLGESDETTKPWKGRESHALDLLRWCLRNLDEKTIEQNWPWVVPPVLSIVDDFDIKFKAEGCRLLKLLLDQTSPILLTRTGLGEVFQEAILPCLSYLPTLTPEEESVALLSAAYPALLSLSRAMSDKTEKKGTKQLTPGEFPRHIKLLDTMIRKGVLAAYTNCPENVKITEVLLNNLCDINKELGIESVRHLKYVLPVLSEVLGHPFGQLYPPTLLAATRALQSVILNGWPRMTHNKGEVLKGLTLCWIHIHDEHSKEIDDLRNELRRTVMMLRDAVGKEDDIRADFAELIDADRRLEGLLRVD